MNSTQEWTNGTKAYFSELSVLEHLTDLTPTRLPGSRDNKVAGVPDESMHQGPDEEMRAMDLEARLVLLQLVVDRALALG